ncbi:hypothetical protein E8E13_011159 [Curvularia kusanoi]|uniref:F-box domain-containing protein n=1 Tax=Curvularia kusanoi TaxID=90978 RepID=A0A9P4TKG1_CURKU|nr:hypothetical protein E8E13_011159 [Curvularia kusanoi]
MASILSLSAELKLGIIEQLDLTSSSFIPGPSQELLNLSCVCRTLRELALPYIFQDLVLLNNEKNGTSMLEIFKSALAVHARSIHYIGVMMIPEEDGNYNAPKPSDSHLPSTVQEALSSLGRLPNLERVVVEFRCAMTEDEDEGIYEASYDIYGEPESDEQVVEGEQTEAYRSLMKRSYDALAQNSASSIRSLEFRNVVAKRCSSWSTSEFRTLLSEVDSFTISLRGGGNGVGWLINRVVAYLAFVESLDDLFFRHLHSARTLRLSATTDGPPGLEGGMNNAGLPLKVDQLPNLRSLELKHFFISRSLATFITKHCNTLKEVRLNNCYSGLGDFECADGVAISWAEFFSTIASIPDCRPRVFHTFEVGPSDWENAPNPKKDEYGYQQALQTKALRETFPGRRMFDYKRIDDKYGMLFDFDEILEERFKDGADHASWQRLMRCLEQD